MCLINKLIVKIFECFYFPLLPNNLKPQGMRELLPCGLVVVGPAYATPSAWTVSLLKETVCLYQADNCGLRLCVNHTLVVVGKYVIRN